MAVVIEALESRRLFAVVPAGFTDSTVVTGLTNPTAMELTPDGRILVAQQGGQLRVVENGVLLPAPALTVTTDSSGERGLIGVTIDPNFATNGVVYLYYTATSPATHNRVSRFTMAGNTIDPTTEVVLLDLDNLSMATNHNGGALHFGLDGKLYIATGENANGANAQNLNNLLGKILRINSDGTIPADNPFFGTLTGDNRAIWAYGLRNPFTFAFDELNGRMRINDVGEATFEEVNAGVAGGNYGWPATEGPTTNLAFVTPIYWYGRSEGQAITGGTFYRPDTLSFGTDYAGDYFISDLLSGFIRRLEGGNGNAISPFATGLANPVDLDVNPAGDLLYLERAVGSPTGGRIGRISVDNTPTPTPDQPPTATIKASATRYKATQIINFTATATDAEDGPLSPEGNIIAVYYEAPVTNASTLIATFNDVSSGSFQVPAIASTNPGGVIKIIFNAFDSATNATTAELTIRPVMITTRVIANVPGASYLLDGTPMAIGSTYTTLSGTPHVITAVAPPDTATRSFNFRQYIAGNRDNPRTLTRWNSGFALMVFSQTPISSTSTQSPAIPASMTTLTRDRDEDEELLSSL